MRFVKSMIGCGLVFFLVCGVTLSQERRRYGGQWQLLNLSERTLYLSGLQEGVYHMMLFAQCITGALPCDLENLKFNQSQKEKINIEMNKRLKGMDISSIGTDVVADVMVDLYRDSANTFIPWVEMAEVAVMKLQGKSENDIRRALENLRQTVDSIYEKRKKHSNK